MTPYTDDKIEPLIREFSALLCLDLGRDTVRKIVAKNAEYHKQGKTDVCASHDYCDANMVMLEAVSNLKIVTKPDGTFDEDRYMADIADDSACRLWNAAWDMAKVSAFFLDKPENSDPN